MPWNLLRIHASEVGRGGFLEPFQCQITFWSFEHFLSRMTAYAGRILQAFSIAFVVAVFVFLRAAAMARVVTANARDCAPDGAARIQCIGGFFRDNLKNGLESNRVCVLQGLSSFIYQIVPGFR